MHYVLFYDVVPDYLERRGEYRAEHLGLAQAALDRGELLAGGAFAEPADGAMLAFRVEGAAEKFAQADPYVRNGLVRSWKVRKWNVVVGDGRVP